MPIEFLCKTCDTTLRVPDEHAGKQARCPKCQTLNLIQAGSLQTAQRSTSHAPQSKPVNKQADSPFTSNPYAASSVTPGLGGTAGHPYMNPHRGPLILVCGILSIFFCFIPGIIAWAMGHSDLKAMSAGYMDPDGRGITQAGMIMGIIGTILPLIGIALYIVMIVIFVFAAAVA